MLSKRVFDFFSSLLGLIILSPIFAILYLLIKFSSNGPVFFKQIRVGKNEVPFEIIKFRTMKIDAEKNGPQITIGERDPRVTSLGFFLRKYKLDEIPQLWNVLIGEMSLVGPRPEVPKYVALYTSDQKEVLNVRPGITDLASIEFREENEYLKQFNDPEKAYINEVIPKKIKLNMEYIKNQSLIYDIKLILITLHLL